MKTIAKIAAAALMAGGAALSVSAPAKADVGFSIGINSGPAYYGYDYYRPCRWYYQHDYPAPSRCYREYSGFYGPGVYVYNGFVFRNRDSYYRHWRDRDDFRRWSTHDWRRHDNDWRRDRDHDWHDRDRDRDRDDDNDHNNHNNHNNHDNGDWHRDHH